MVESLQGILQGGGCGLLGFQSRLQLPHLRILRRHVALHLPKTGTYISEPSFKFGSLGFKLRDLSIPSQVQVSVHGRQSWRNVGCQALIHLLQQSLFQNVNLLFGRL